MEPRDSVNAQHVHCRDIEGPGESLVCRNGSIEPEIIVLGGKSVDVYGNVGQQCPRQDIPLLKKRTVQKRLEYASRAPRGLQDVNLAARTSGGEGNIAAVCKDIHCPYIDHYCRQIMYAFPVEFPVPSFQDSFGLPLQADVYGCSVPAVRLSGLFARPSVLPVRNRMSAESQVRGILRQGKRFIGKRFAAGQQKGRGVDFPPVQQYAEKPVPFLFQQFPVPAGMYHGRCIRQDSQCSCFSPGQFGRWFSEISPCGSLKSDYIASERGVCSVEGHDFILAAPQFEPCGQYAFHYFLPYCSFTAPGQPDDLHCYRAPAADGLSG